MYSVFYTQESEDNLVEIFEFIADDSNFYAAKVVTSIKSTVDILKLFPLSGRCIDEDKRMIVDSKYRYKIVYQVRWNDVYIVSISKYKNL